MYDLKRIYKAAKSGGGGLPKIRVAAVCDTSAQQLVKLLRGCAVLRGFDAEVYDAGYDRIASQLCDGGSELYKFKPDYILLYISSEKALGRFRALGSDTAARKNFAAETLSEIKIYLDKIAEFSGAAVFVCDFAEFDDGVFGDFALTCRESFLYQIKRLNFMLAEELSERKTARLKLMGLNLLQARMGRENTYDERIYLAARVALTEQAAAELSERAVTAIAALRGGVKKALVLDLDNTLWGGVIAEDGIANIEVGEIGDGRAFSALQSWVKELGRRGIILAVCSKNDEAAAREPFESHSDMLLRLSDIAIFTANWNDKASNIRAAAKELNIGLDSMVFLDDNPFEREQVRSALPEVTVPELPDDPALRLPYLISLDLFETVSLSEEDAARNSNYIAESARKAELIKYSNYNQYLSSLDMKGEAFAAEPFYYSRISQLSQRSNQFNLRTVRYTESDIARIAADPGYMTRIYTLSDRFGDYGLIAAAVMRRESEGWFLENLFMSCRVLSRGVERFITNDIVKAAAGEVIAAEYIPTAKNSLVKNLLPELGFSSSGDGKYRMDTSKYIPACTYIKLIPHEKKGD